jgi:Spy/CpxP family protein refolding chaperone
MADSTPSPSHNRTRTTLMVMSLCLNVGLIALILVEIGRGGGGFVAQAGVMAPGQIARGLPPQQREKILDIAAAHRDAMRERRQAARRARLEAFRILGAPDYTASDFTRALDAVRAADAGLEEEAVALQQDVVNTLTPSQRKLIAERAEARRGRPFWRRLMRPQPNP